MQASFKRITICALICFLVLICLQKPINAKTRAALNHENLALFLNNFFTAELGDHELPGAAVVVVKDGVILFSEGYGYANLEENIPVLPSDTVFFVESVSKSFTATALMHMFDLGLVDLTQDVNTYLTAFQLPAAFEMPVTVADLLVHTGGFDDTDIGAYAVDENSVIPLREYLKTHFPARVMPPGEVVSYSNYGYALAGLIIEEVSGEPYTDYMQNSILKPLQMDNSSFVINEEMEDKLALPYHINDKNFIPFTFLFHNYSPAGGLKATPEDMANFMILHLQEGQFMNKNLVSPSAIKMMHQQQFTHHEQLPGWTFGFYEKFFNGYRIITHGGANRLGHMSELLLIPEENLGLFFAANTFNPRVRDKLVDDFLKHFFPAADQPILKQDLLYEPEAVKKYAGSYYSTRQARNSVEKIMLLLGQFTIEADENLLRINFPQGFQAADEVFEKVEALLFRGTENGTLVAFREDDRGNITHMFIENYAFEKLPWHTYPTFQIIILFATIAGLVSIFFRRPQPGYKHNKESLNTAKYLSFLHFIFLAGVVLIFANYQVELAYGMPVMVKLLFALPFVSLALTAVVIYFCILTWISYPQTYAYPVHYTIYTISAVGFMVFLAYWNLVGLY